MAKFTLSIETEDTAELAEIALKLAQGFVPPSTSAVVIDPLSDMVRGTPREVAEAAEVTAPTGEAVKRRGRPPKAKDEATVSDEFSAGGKPVEAAPVEAPSPAPAPAPANEDVTYDSLKSVLTDVLKAKSAKDAQDIIRNTTDGAASSLTQLKPEQYPAVYAALKKALG